MSRIHVHVVKYRECKNLVLRYIDPITGKPHRSTKYRDPHTGVETETGTNKKFARKLAGLWEADLNSGRDQGRHTVTWEQFRLRYENEVLPGLAENTGIKVCGVFNTLESILSAVESGKLVDLTADRISYLQAELRKRGRAESTIAGHLAHLKAALRWAADQGMIPTVPKIKRLRRAKKTRTTSPMKGRPVTGEEFDRMAKAAAEVVGEESAATWRWYLEGLWWSGLRLEESLELHWDRADKFRVDLTGKRPMFHVLAEGEKGFQDRLLPMAPEFAEMLLAVAEADRRGRVFKLSFKGKPLAGVSRFVAGKIISDIGRKAGIKVHTKTVKTPKTDEPVEKVKFASAHDLRRSFGERWAARVMPQVLMILMRHECISTTMRYYVGRNANTTADAVWAAYPNAKTGTVFGTVAQSDSHDEVAAKGASHAASATTQTTCELAEAGLEPAREVTPTGF